MNFAPLAPQGLAALVAFFLGSIPFSWILARLRGGIDLRATGSGNVGATNLARSVGYGAGTLALLLDAAKGAAAVLLARALAAEGPAGTTAEAIAGGLAILGHSFTPFLRFRGGKGVATGAGVFAILAPWALGVSVLVFAVAVAASRMVSVGSVLASATLPAAIFLLGGDRRVTALAILSSALVIARHRSNLARILAGNENRIGRRDRQGRPS